MCNGVSGDTLFRDHYTTTRSQRELPNWPRAIRVRHIADALRGRHLSRPEGMGTRDSATQRPLPRNTDKQAPYTALLPEFTTPGGRDDEHAPALRHRSRVRLVVSASQPLAALPRGGPGDAPIRRMRNRRVKEANYLP
jgi:hypothetical protein